MQKYITFFAFLSEDHQECLGREWKSGSEGGDAKGKAITWVFYKEMAFMMRYVYI